ncbi:MAG TPA: amino acid-binding protein, partial [Acetobacteraceae bacterium]|nr:amino acid-binding protein [Acetobacteraceae bacterium]
AGGFDKDKVRAAVLATNAPSGAQANGWGARFDDKGQNLEARPLLLQWQAGALRTVLPEGPGVGRLRPRLGG